MKKRNFRLLVPLTALLSLAGFAGSGASCATGGKDTRAAPNQRLECKAPGANNARATRPPLGYTKKLAGVADIKEALAKVTAALKVQGFGVITHIDVQATMKKKLGVAMKPYWILGACNPKLAHKALEADKTLGLLLPCKVIVYQDSAGTFVVSFARPKTIFTLVADPRLAPIADEVDKRFRRALEAL